MTQDITHGDKRDAVAIQKILDKYELNDKDREILQLKVKHPKMHQSEMAKIVGLSRQKVNGRLNKDKMKQALAEMNRPAKEMLESMAERAMRRYIKLAFDEGVEPSTQERFLSRILKNCGVFKDSDDSVGVKFEPIVIELSNDRKIIIGPKQSVIPTESIEIKGE